MHRSRIATKSVKDARPIRRTGRFWPSDVVENPRRTNGSDCGFLLAGNQNRSGAIGPYHRHLVSISRQAGNMLLQCDCWVKVQIISRGQSDSYVDVEVWR